MKDFRNVVLYLLLLFVTAYASGITVPVLGANPCTSWFRSSVYVLNGCYVIGRGWVGLP